MLSSEEKYKNIEKLSEPTKITYTESILNKFPPKKVDESKYLNKLKGKYNVK